MKASAVRVKRVIHGDVSNADNSDRQEDKHARQPSITIGARGDASATAGIAFVQLSFLGFCFSRQKTQGWRKPKKTRHSDENHCDFPDSHRSGKALLQSKLQNLTHQQQVEQKIEERRGKKITPLEERKITRRTRKENKPPKRKEKKLLKAFAAVTTPKDPFKR